MRNHGVNEFDNKFKIIGEIRADEKRDDDDFAKYTAPETTFEVFHKILIEECDKTEFLLQLKRFILDYIIDKIHLDKNQGKYPPKDGKYFTADAEDRDADLYKLNLPYNEEFWKNYNTVKLNPLKRTPTELEKNKSLEEQFKRANKKND